MLSVTFNPFMLSVVMLNVIILRVVMLSVVAPLKQFLLKKHFFFLSKWSVLSNDKKLSDKKLGQSRGLKISR
jgi:hypothetical protein